MKPGGLERFCTFCAGLTSAPRLVKNARVAVLLLAGVLMVVQDALLKSITGFPVTSIEPCNDPREGREFFFVQWRPMDSNANVTCAQAALLSKQIKDSSFATLPLPKNNSMVGRTATELLDDPIAGAGLRYVWGLATLTAPFVWFLAEAVAVLLPRFYGDKGRWSSACSRLMLLVLCFIISVVSNLMLLVNASVQWQDQLGVFAATLSALEAAIYFTAAVLIVLSFALVLLLVAGRALGACCFNKCRRLCRCVFGADDEEDALRGLMCRILAVSVFICTAGTLLKLVLVGSLAGEYADEAQRLASTFQNVTFGSFTSFLDQPSATADFVGDYVVYQRRTRPTQSAQLRGYAGVRDALSVVLTVELALTIVALIVSITVLFFQSCNACCKRAHQARV